MTGAPPTSTSSGTGAERPTNRGRASRCRRFEREHSGAPGGSPRCPDSCLVRAAPSESRMSAPACLSFQLRYAPDSGSSLQTNGFCSEAPMNRDQEPRVLQLNHKLTPAELDDVVVAYEAGASLRTPGRRFQVHEQTVRRQLQRRGVTLRQGAKGFSSEQLAEPVVAYESAGRRTSWRRSWRQLTRCSGHSDSPVLSCEVGWIDGSKHWPATTSGRRYRSSP
jgi:hypothetical protein